MTTPNVTIRKQDFNTGVVRPGADGILAIVAAAAAGTQNEASAHNDETNAKTEFSFGPLAEFAAYEMPIAKKPVVLVRPTTTTAGAYSAIVETGEGSSAVTAGATAPYDDFDVIITFLVGATIGVAGATYTYSLDGGKTTSAVLALGTANAIVIPETNITVDFGVGNVLANQTIAFQTTRPLCTNTDLPAALEALRVTSSPFDAVLVDMLADDTTVPLVGTWLGTLNAKGRFPVVYLTVRPMGAAESETTYKNVLATMLAQVSCLDIVLCADEGDVVSPFRGITQARPTGLLVAARAMAVDIGTEPAEVDLGPLDGVRISDARGNPLHHNEDKYPGLDDLRLTTLRTIEGEEGVFITNTKLLSPTGSDYVFLPHGRVINKAAGIAYQTLTRLLSKGVTKNPKPGPNGERYIADHAAQLFEHLVQGAIDPAVKGKVDDLRFTISRTDDISSNQGAGLTCYLESVALAYVKSFTVYARYVKQIAQ